MVLEKATQEETKDPDNKVFLAEAEHIGYVPGEKEYKETERNDLPTIAQEYHEFQESPREGLLTENPKIVAEIQENIISEDRGDPSYYISQYTDYDGGEKRIGDIAEITQPKMNPSLEKLDEEFLHLSVRDLNESTGGIRSLNRKLGSDIEKSQTYFEGGQILLTRIRPSLDNKKISIVPESVTQGVGSGEFLVVDAKEGYDPYYLLQALRTDYAIGQLVSKATGSTGRQRIRVEDVLETKIPWPEDDMREKISDRTGEGLALIREGKDLINQADL